MKKKLFFYRRIFKWIALILLCFLCSFCSFETTEKRMEDEMEDAKTAVVRLQAKQYIGSGIIYSINAETITIVSAKHILETVTAADIFFEDGSVAHGNVVGYSIPYDIAFLVVYTKDMEDSTLRSIAPMNCIKKEEYAKIQQEDDIFYIGSSQSVASDIFTGKVVNTNCFIPEFNEEMLVCRPAILPGMSGGGAFDKEGRLIGIITGSNDDNSVSVPAYLLEEEFFKCMK